MNKCNIGGHDFYYEQINFGPAGGASVFAIKDVVEAKEFDMYWVVIPINDWDGGVANPKDGHVACMCKGKIEAKTIASAINIAQDLSSRVTLENLIKTKLKSLEDKYDLNAITEEVVRLRNEGKSDDEILDLMKDKRETFLRKKSAETNKNGGEW